MSRATVARIVLVVVAVAAVVVVGKTVAGRVRPPAPSPTGGWMTFTPSALPSPTPIVGLGEYARPTIDVAIPVATAAPSASPTRPPLRPRVKVRTAASNDGGSGRRSGSHIRGTATWHATGRNGMYAAAGPALRRAIGRGWRGRVVTVCADGSCIRLTLNDYCPCGEKSRRPDKLIDLSDEAFGRLAPLSRGVLRAVVWWAGEGTPLILRRVDDAD